MEHKSWIWRFTSRWDKIKQCEYSGLEIMAKKPKKIFLLVEETQYFVEIPEAERLLKNNI